jgi:hypothetical protein
LPIRACLPLSLALAALSNVDVLDNTFWGG